MKITARFKTKPGCAVAVVLVGGLLTAMNGTGQTGAAPVVQVKAGAAARTAPHLNNTFVGWVLSTGGTDEAAYGSQPSPLLCWQYGAWATGAYESNLWYKVAVWDSSRGFVGPASELFVHSSLVANQKPVGHC